MEEEFNKLKQQGKNNVDNLIKWMQDSNILESTKSHEENARKLLSDVQDTANVEFAKFQEVVEVLAAEQKTTAENLSKSLIAKGSEAVGAAVSAVEAGANAAFSAFKQAMNK